MHEGSSVSCTRSDQVTVDETAVVAYLLRDQRGPNNVMLDVGAHFGTSAAEFAKLDWRIVCFEPDPKNRAKLWSRFGGSAQISIDPRAVGERAESARPFFASEESTGISGMLKFRDTHHEVAKVEVTTVADAMKTYGLRRIDFLKIDVEGYDFAVLKGVPWDGIAKPGVIECEFEDSKTSLLGHTIDDMAAFLMAKGYVVYVSEWHPIIRYGTRHDWRRVFRYREAKTLPDAWGNILAFTQDPGKSVVTAAFEACLKRNVNLKVAKASPVAQKERSFPPAVEKAGADRSGAKQTVNGSGTRPLQAPEMTLYTSIATTIEQRLPFLVPPGRVLTRNLRGLRRRAGTHYTSIATTIDERSPALVRIVRAGKRQARGLLRHPVVVYGGILVAVLIVAALIHEPTRALFLGAAGVVALSMLMNAVIAYYTLEILERSQKLAREVDRSMLEFRKFEAELSSTKGSIADLSSSMKTHFNEIAAQTIAQTGSVSRAEGRLSKKLVETEVQSSKLVLQMEERFTYLVSELETQFSRLASQTEAQFSKLASQTESQLSATNRKHSDLMSTIARTPVLNGIRFQTFNRQVTPALNRSLADWSTKLGSGFNMQGVGYLASRIGWLELRMHGRLATSIEDILLRGIVIKAAGGEPREVLEIGTLFGIGAAALNEAVAFDSRGIQLTLLDPLDGYYGQDSDIRTQMPINEEVLQANMRIAGIPPETYTVIKQFSTDPAAIEIISRKRYDVAIIDGDHSYEGVKFDFENYAPFVKAGGYIIIDDFNSADWPSVTQFVNAELMSHPGLEFVGAQFRTAIFRVTDAAALRANPIKTN